MAEIHVPTKKTSPQQKIDTAEIFLVLSFLSSIGMEEIWKGKEGQEMDATLGCHPTYRSSDLQLANGGQSNDETWKATVGEISTSTAARRSG